MICPGCSHDNKYSWRQMIHGIDYIRCPDCDTIYTTQNISKVLVTDNDKPELRNNEIQHSVVLNRISNLLITDKILDFGCGNGEFVEYLKNKGYKAEGTNADIPSERYSAIFMIEVIEHLRSPKKEIEKLVTHLLLKGYIYIETTFSDQIGEDLASSPYVDPRIGHISILSQKALQSILPNSLKMHIINDNVIILEKIW
jgi:Methyltransferase domain